uniref:DUF5658 domain-containing protein n=1 Tax=Globodera pallida TaxID=36090 RepID=A0A183CE64_GLOPA
MGNGGMGTLMKINGLTFSGTLMVLYSLCWFTVFRLNATSKNVNANNRKLIKSLIFIIGLNLIGVFVKSSCSIYALLNSIQTTAEQQQSGGAIAIRII